MTAQTFSTDDAEWLRQWVRKRTGIALRADQQYLLDTRLIPVARDFNVEVEELVAMVRGARPAAVQAVVDAITTNETSWFRDIHPFETLANEILPERVKANDAAGRRELSVWSAASSSGQELLSLAMIIADRFPDLATPLSVRLTGTDVSSRMVKRANEARFTQLEVDRGLPARYLVRFFDHAGNDWVVKPEIQRLVRFSQQNLVTDPPPGTFDVILCRYVLIYFDDEARARVMRSIAEALNPGGVLILGASEIGGPHLSMFRARSIGRTVVYERP